MLHSKSTSWDIDALHNGPHFTQELCRTLFMVSHLADDVAPSARTSANIVEFICFQVFFK